MNIIDFHALGYGIVHWCQGEIDVMPLQGILVSKYRFMTYFMYNMLQFNSKKSEILNSLILEA
ncbi:hypothetical protein AM228_17700 [Planktothricoides sp. SR001]|nr:hypothetical protein AM228_17700 [Planktothricoides sp. SR001]